MTTVIAPKILLFTIMFFLAGLEFPCEPLETIELPQPSQRGSVSVEEAIFKRRSYRSFRNEPLKLAEVSQLLWAAGGRAIDGLTGASRSYPSAGGLYPVEIYLMAGSVIDLQPGVYHYSWRNHSLRPIASGDLRPALTRAGLFQRSFLNAPATILLAAVFERTESKYGRRGTYRYVPLDTGHSSENIHLQAVALGLGTVTIGAFQDEAVKRLFRLDEEEPLLLIPVGRIDH